MARIPNIKIVAGESKHDVTIYNLDTGEAISNIYAIELVADANDSPVMKVRITAGIKFEYEGPAEVEPLVVKREEETA